MKITATHRYGFHPGEWFDVTGVELVNNRPCFEVSIRYKNDPSRTVTDWWPVYDPSDPYEFQP